MDRQGRAAAVLGVGLAVVFAIAADKTDLSVIHAARWLAPSADRVRALGSLPTECLGPARDADQAYAIDVGRAAFRTPLLLGGQAARAGLSCESCHRAGRNNPDFFFPGISGVPGTADVTTPLLSTHEDDGVVDPKPIPDLSGPKSKLKVSQAPGGDALQSHIHGIATREFDGAEPPPAVMAGLAAYVRALSPDACSKTDHEPLRAALYLRVSTARQAEHDVSIPDQREQGEAYCASRSYQLVETYVEPGASATNDRRRYYRPHRRLTEASERRSSASRAG